MRVRVRSTAGSAAARLWHTGAELAYCDTGIRTSVRKLAVWAVTFLEFRRASPSSFSFELRREVPRHRALLHRQQQHPVHHERQPPRPYLDSNFERSYPNSNSYTRSNFNLDVRQQRECYV